MKSIKIVLSLITLLFSLLAFAENPIVVFETNKGNFEMELYPDKAPVSVENFLTYVGNKFYDNTIVHRVVKNFVIQAGGMSTDLKEKAPLKDPIINEATNGLSNLEGTVAYARTDEINSANTDFFVNLKDNLFLNHVDDKKYGYAVFGKIISGFENILSISTVEVNSVGEYDDVPTSPVMIVKAYRKN